MHMYSHFEEKGYRIEAYIPDTDTDIDGFEIRVLIRGELKKTLYVPLTYLPVFGLDVGDVNKLEAFADAMMNALPEAQSFDMRASAALDEIETDFGGQSVRSRIAEGNSGSRGQFESTRDAFVNTIAGQFGGLEGAEKWMKMPASELGGRTPEVALRAGMAPEVFQYLQHARSGDSQDGFDEPK